MKIEKINDRQIRCVLTREDLEDRKIRLSELVSGGEKARGLLRDMIGQAARELGFSLNNNPLMIEAMPTSKDQLVLVITRVDDPGEIDKRFRSLSGLDDPEKEVKGDSSGASSGAFPSADEILNMLRSFTKRLKEQRADQNDEGRRADSKDADGQRSGNAVQGTETKKPGGSDVQATETKRPGSGSAVQEAEAKTPGSGRISEEAISRYTRFYLFRTLEHVLDASRRVPESYAGENTLYKNPDDGAFYLLIKKNDTDPEQFNRICNVLSEYSMPMDYSTGMDEFFKEHMQVLAADHALQNLRGV